MHKKYIIKNTSYLVECAENKVDENNNETNISEMPDLLIQVEMDGPNATPTGWDGWAKCQPQI